MPAKEIKQITIYLDVYRLKEEAQRPFLGSVDKILALVDHLIQRLKGVILNFQVPARVLRRVVLHKVDVLPVHAEPFGDAVDQLIDGFGDFEFLFLVVDDPVGESLAQFAFDKVDFGDDDEGVRVAL